MLPFAFMLKNNSTYSCKCTPLNTIDIDDLGISNESHERHKEHQWYTCICEQICRRCALTSSFSVINNR